MHTPNSETPKAGEQPTYAKPLCSNHPAHPPKPIEQAFHQSCIRAVAVRYPEIHAGDTPVLGFGQVRCSFDHHTRSSARNQRFHQRL